jgi:hypothetical protein
MQSNRFTKMGNPYIFDFLKPLLISQMLCHYILFLFKRIGTLQKYYLECFKLDFVKWKDTIGSLNHGFTSVWESYLIHYFLSNTKK